MESLVDLNFWKNKRVLVTGHTGFKGAWLTLLLKQVGAKVVGYSLEPQTSPNLFQLAQIESVCVESVIGDICNHQLLEKTFLKHQPEIVFHMAAQSLVRSSYHNPVETYQTNVMGTLYALQACSLTPSIRAVVVVTSDKCYQNQEWVWGYRENEPLGGLDPYSSSKACAELLTASYRASYCTSPEKFNIGTARAGNVIGGGDWASDRLIPDIIRANVNKTQLSIRSPSAIRPWQHVLDPLTAYMKLAQKLCSNEAKQYTSAWNFGPSVDDARTVEWIVGKITEQWSGDAVWKIDEAAASNLHEAKYLKLDCAKANAYLSWSPRWNINKALEQTVLWYKAWHLQNEDMQAFCNKQINDFLHS